MSDQIELFDNTPIKIRLPQINMTPININGNKINRTILKEIIINVSTISDENGLIKITSQLNEPLKTLYLKRKGSRAIIPNKSPCLKIEDDIQINELNEHTILKWINTPDFSMLTPSIIVESWKGKFSFEHNRNEALGLRIPQLGALHAIASNFTLSNNFEPITLVLPTGTGKTETLLATLVHQQCYKSLILVPSNTLRNQLNEKLLNLGCLSEIQSISDDTNLPYVGKITKSLRSIRDAEIIASESNVMIATPNILNASDSRSIDKLCELCTHLFVDEAHHISANTWKSIRQRFIGKKVIQFTATPFRTDGKSLGGRIIYNYTMSEAQKTGYFTPITLHSIEEFYDENANRSIAEKAVSILKNDLASGFDHLLLARAKSKDTTTSLYSIYNKVAPELNPIVVHSSMSKYQITNELNKLLSRKSRIVICVNMLGEGYDLPNLKIAAIHDNHKSLAITLQFIGRFTRISSKGKIGHANVVMNIADPEVEKGLEKLYSQGADWDSLLSRLSETRIEKEIKLQDVIESLKSSGDLHEHISLWNLRPSYSAMLFNANCSEWNTQNVIENLPKFHESWYSISEEEKIVIILGLQESRVKWGEYKDLFDINYKILILHHDIERNAIYVFSNDYKVFKTEKMVKGLTNGSSELICGSDIFKIFNGIEYPLARNLGASQIGAISFTQYFGPNVTDGLSLIESSDSTLSNIAVLGYENGERVIWGCSQRKGKIWSPQKGGSINDWIEWTRRTLDRIRSEDIDSTNITENFLRPVKIQSPYKGYPIAVQWGEFLYSAYEDKIIFKFGTNEVEFYNIDLSIDGIDDENNVKIRISSDNYSSIYIIKISGYLPFGYEYALIEGENISIEYGKNNFETFNELMLHDPIMVHYSNRSFTYNNFLVEVPDIIGLFERDKINIENWDGIDIRKESMGISMDQDSIQFKYFKLIEDDYEIIINDDGAGEAADLIGLKIVNNEILLSMIHCKYSKEFSPGTRLQDFYEVCGQAQRCIRFKHLGINYLYHHIKHRNKTWKKSGHTRFLKGDISSLAAYKSRSRVTKINFEVSIVQPGLSKKNVSDEILKLLGSTELYIKKTTKSALNVISSE